MQAGGPWYDLSADRAELVSRKLTQALRHNHRLWLDSQGYASLKDVIWLTRTPISEAEVRFAAEHSYKHGRPRFSFRNGSMGELLIRRE